MRRVDPSRLAGAHEAHYATLFAEVTVHEVKDMDGRSYWRVVTTDHRSGSADVTTTLLYEDCEPEEAAADALQYTYVNE
ncbi:hypothetical protein [Phytoactinopolyspora halotolerans]|uniref:Uncharacterized protein n=1 Tax=Phytoactinopolyspora halotolerans TaxID=1981512 RepID=A0A6L9SEK5_9ACTN|nr:hypothetical protein [Phytoactinopolyspora halotolerans]NEE03064.1 hypothetical protein [Phytoactinopolyspora halotolerans]